MDSIEYNFNNIPHLYSINDCDNKWKVELNEKITNFVNEDELPFNVIFSNPITNNKIWECELHPNGWVSFDKIKTNVSVFNRKNEFIFGENYMPNKNYDLIEQCLLLNLKKLNLKRGLVVGAGNGEYGEWSSIVKNNLCDVVLIEPYPLSYAKLKDNFKSYKNTSFINGGVDLEDGESVFWVAPEGNVSSLIKDVCLSYGFSEENLTKIEIKTYSMNNLISNNNIDWVRLDTEGMDCKLINSITVENLKKLKYVQYEHINVSENDKISTNLFLEKNGFNVFMVGIDMVGIKK